ncbi:MAG: ABC transporter permease [Candidatus Zixiibacteriota bacterium]
MLTAIIEKEIREILGSAKFGITFGACIVLILLSFYVGAMNYKSSVEQYNAAKAQNLRQMEGLTSWLSLEQHRIFMPPQPLAALVTGSSNDVGRTIGVHRRSSIAAEDSKFSEDPIYAVFRFLDLTFIFQIVLSLFAILLGYDAVCGEKERGTLRLSFANAVPRATYILGKLIGSFVTLVTALILAILLGCLLLPLLGVSLTGDEWVRLAIIIGTGLLYFAVFLSISVFVSTITHRSSSAFLTLLVIWVISVLIVPRASVLLAGRAVDVPAVDNIAAQKATFSKQLWQDHQKAMGAFKPPENHDPTMMMDLFNAYMDSLSQIRESKMNEFSDRLNEDRHNRQKVQQQVAFNLARISPTASLTLAATRLAGTSIDIKDRFYESGIDYKETFADFMKEKTGMNITGGMFIVQSDGEEQEPIDPKEMPEYVYQPEPLRASLAGSVVDIGILALFNLVFFIGAFVSFTRYDVR